jgi:hypothetical protein
MDNCNHGTNVIACPMCAVDRLIKERDEAQADLQNLRDILLSQIPLTKMPGTTLDLLRQLVQQRDEARAKAIQFDLDRAGIEQRAAEAAELVDLRAEVARLKTERNEAQASIERMSALHTELHASAMEWQAEVELLRKALHGLRLDEWMTYEGNLEASGYASVDALEFARTALAGKKEEI